jgi:hypothetical protein
VTGISGHKSICPDAEREEDETMVEGRPIPKACV